MTSNTNADYDQWAEYYDLVSGDRSLMIAFYEGLVRDGVSTVLELACGTGTVLGPLAQRVIERRRGWDGVRIAGVDGSANMLKIARERNPRLEWILGDMRRPPVSGKFDLIVCCYNTLHECQTDDDVLHMFGSARTLLADHGTFAFDLYQPNVEYLKAPQQNRLVRRVRGHLGKELELREDAFYDAASRVYTLNWRIEESGVQKAPVARLCYRYRQYYAADVERLLASAGLAILERFGDLDRSPFTPESKKQVVVCGVR